MIRWPAVALGLLLFTGGCADVTAAGVTDSAPAMDVPAVPASTAGVDVTTAVRHTIDQFNATSGGSVAAQQAALDSLVSEGQSSVQSRCPAANSTISFEPVYARLAPSPAWKPTSGTLPGTVYALPTLIRVYTGDRITGTDLTDLHVSIEDGQARLPALCLA